MILDTIVDKKKEEISLLKKNGVQIPEFFQEREVDSPRGFRGSLIEFEGVSIIAEAKKASPSKGVISTDFDVAKIVKHYEDSGAQAVSVLTDVSFFQGSLEYMMLARQTTKLPVIRKDFIIDELQIQEASLCGADAILLIAAILDEGQIHEYFLYAKEMGMDVLTEVHNEKELEKTLRAEVDLVGVNNRNLKTFSVDIDTTFRLSRLMPKGLPLVSESGLKSPEDIKKLHEHNICAALIGETLMRDGTAGSALAGLRKWD